MKTALIILIFTLLASSQTIYQLKDSKGTIIMESNDPITVTKYTPPPPIILILKPGVADSLKNILIKKLPDYKLPFYSISWSISVNMQPGTITINKNESGKDLLILNSFGKLWLETAFPGILDSCNKK